jgi:hypothetical protein
MLRLNDDEDSCELSHSSKGFLHDCRMYGVNPFDFEYEVDPEPEMAGHEAARQALEDFLRDCRIIGVDPFDFGFKVDPEGPEPEMSAIFKS